MNNIQARNNVKIIGGGKTTIVFGHGFGCDQKIWDFLIPYFEKDNRIVLFDYVGSGKSDMSAYDEERYKNLEGYSKDILEILDELDLGSVVFIGHSVSGMIGLLAAIEKPEYFKTLVMICPSSRYLNDKPDYFGGFGENDVKELLKMMEMNFIGWATMNAAALINAPEQPMLADHLKETFCKENSFIMRDFAKATFLSDHRCDLPKLTVPSLIIQCSEDSVVPIEAANYLHENLKNSILRVMDTKGHYPNISSPKETADIILQYLC
ncbi:alpha/beta hydrolase [Clostridium sp.]|uniref:alpha/beta fold hydrolase n=1 Tax=Clostridium sp. TaxID=1506 RepID=UPI0026070DCD|nr:alpha/beta hydrolase [Clostridium sp.]